MSDTPSSNGTLSYAKASSSKKDMSFSPVLGSESSSEEEDEVHETTPYEKKPTPSAKNEEDSSEEEDKVHETTPYEKKPTSSVKNEEDSSEEEDEVHETTPYEKKPTSSVTGVTVKNGEGQRKKKIPMMEMFGNHPSSGKVAKFARDSPHKHKNPNVPDNSKTQPKNHSDYSCNSYFREAREILTKEGMKKRLEPEFDRIVVEKRKRREYGSGAASGSHHVKRNNKRYTGPSVLAHRLSEDIRVDELSRKRPKKGL